VGLIHRVADESVAPMTVLCLSMISLDAACNYY